MSKKLNIDLLNDFIIEYIEESSDRLISSLEDTFKPYSIEDIYDLFWDIKKTCNPNPDVEAFYNLKETLLQIFLDKFESPASPTTFILNNQNVLDYSIDFIIKIIVDKNSIHQQLSLVLDNYGDLDQEDEKIIVNYFSDLVKEIKKPTKEQQKLIEHILAIYSYKSYKILDDREKNVKLIELEERIIHSTMPINLETELMLRLYLHGDKHVPPSSYYDYWYNYNYKKEDIHLVFDRFTVWLWNWAQKQKPSINFVPKKLKVFCAQLMQLSCKHNSATKYTMNDFRTDNQENIDTAWTNFKTANNGAKTRLIE